MQGIAESCEFVIPAHLFYPSFWSSQLDLSFSWLILHFESYLNLIIWVNLSFDQAYTAIFPYSYEYKDVKDNMLGEAPQLDTEFSVLRNVRCTTDGLICEIHIWIWDSWLTPPKKWPLWLLLVLLLLPTVSFKWFLVFLRISQLFQIDPKYQSMLSLVLP